GNYGRQFQHSTIVLMANWTTSSRWQRLLVRVRSLAKYPIRDGTKRVGKFADKHQMMVGYNGHTKVTPEIWEEAFSFAKFNGANLDLGHFVRGNKTSPVPFLKKRHDRITHIHVKDKTLADKNVAFGMGDTPIKEALQMIRDNKWNIQATIEFEYPVPPGSDRMVEMAKCLQYCRSALLG